jgi:hypothetical protein
MGGIAFMSLPTLREDTLLEQRREDVGHELAERVAVSRGECRQRVMAHPQITDNPAEGVIRVDPPRDFTGAADPARDGVEPERELAARRQDRATCLPDDRLRVGHEHPQLENPDHVP